MRIKYNYLFPDNTFLFAIRMRPQYTWNLGGYRANCLNRNSIRWSWRAINNPQKETLIKLPLHIATPDITGLSADNAVRGWKLPK